MCYHVNGAFYTAQYRDLRKKFQFPIDLISIRSIVHTTALSIFFHHKWKKLNELYLNNNETFYDFKIEMNEEKDRKKEEWDRELNNEIVSKQFRKGKMPYYYAKT